MKKALSIAILLILAMLLLSGCTSKSTISQGEQNTESAIEKEERSVEHNLAIINAGTFVDKDDGAVYRFKYLLDSLEEKTTNSREEIVAMSIKGVELTKEQYGREIKLLDLMEGVNKSIPDEFEVKMEYSDVLSVFIAIYGNQ